MALPILDGNQTATTLSTIVTGGAHIPAHTVVSLGSQAITDMRGAVSGSVVSISNFPASQTIAGTVTANVDDASLLAALNLYATDGQDFPVSIKSTSFDIPISGTVTVGASSVIFNSFVGQRGDGSWQPISLQSGSNYVNANVGAMPSGALTTRFGSVTTANTAQLTSAVTNASRKYLLVQNIATSTVTIGIGFAPTTTQGIQLTAGAGLTFDAFCPTGGVWWLSSTTGSNFSILEG
jgi:hypothetical protein